MSLKEYFYDLNWAPLDESRDDRNHIQEAALGFFLSRAEVLELTAFPLRTRLKLGPFIWRGYTSREDEDEEFRTTRGTLAPFLLRKTTDDRKCGLRQSSGALFHHYFYKLSPEVCSMLVDTGLIWGRPSEFAGFEDPTFYRPNGSLLGRVVTREAYFSFFLSGDERIDLEKRGIALNQRLDHP